MATNGSRFHIEINSIKVDDMAVRFNIFGDTLAQVTADLEQVIAYVTAPASIAPQKSQAATAKPSAPAGVCCACGPPFTCHCEPVGRGNLSVSGVMPWQR